MYALNTRWHHVSGAHVTFPPFRKDFRTVYDTLTVVWLADDFWACKYPNGINRLYFQCKRKLFDAIYSL